MPRRNALTTRARAFVSELIPRSKLRAEIGAFTLVRRAVFGRVGLHMIDSLNAAVAPIHGRVDADVFESFGRALRRRHGLMWPYAHAFLERVFPEHVIRELTALPWPAAQTDGVCGRPCASR